MRRVCLTGPRSCLCSCLPGDVLGAPESAAQAPGEGVSRPPGSTPGPTPTLCVGKCSAGEEAAGPQGSLDFTLSPAGSARAARTLKARLRLPAGGSPHSCFCLWKERADLQKSRGVVAVGHAERGQGLCVSVSLTTWGVMVAWGERRNRGLNSYRYISDSEVF